MGAREGQTTLMGGSSPALVDPTPTPAPPSPTAGARTTGPGPSLGYNPALDGIRGLAVAAVVFFHGGYSWAQGGYLGVSTFFTLSGFLITTLLLAEHHRTGRIALRSFWARRLRRLLPASLVTLGVVMVSAVVTTEAWERRLPGDVLASTLQVANWRFLFADGSYGDLFEDSTSPVLHFWSLAIEEQFYWLFPLLAAGALALGRGSLRAFVGILGALVAASAGLTFLYRDSLDTVYYATPIRMGEILIGSLLAVALARNRDRFVSGTAATRLVPLAGAAALVISVVAWNRIAQDSSWLSQGGLLVYGVVSALLVWAACVPGPLRTLLAIPPLRLLGVISYGIYLIHWPVFLLLSAERTDRLLSPLGLELRGTSLFGLRVAVTLALALLSYHLLEQPIRHGRRPRAGLAPACAGGAMVVVLLLTWVIPRYSPPPPDAFQDAAENIRLPGPELSTMQPDVQVGVSIGDSTMIMASLGLSGWGQDTGRMVLRPGAGTLGCGLARGGDRIYGPSEGTVPGGDCDWGEVLAPNIELAREEYGDKLSFGFILAGPWDMADRRLEGDDEWRHIGDPVYDEYLRSEMHALVDILLDEGLTPVWATTPIIENGRLSGRDGYESWPENDPARLARFNAMVREVAAAHDEMVVVDLHGWFGTLPQEEQDRLRPDGVHFADDTTVEVAALWLGEAIFSAVTSGADVDG